MEPLPNIWYLRTICGLLVIAAVAYPSFYQPVLTATYNYLYSSSFYRLSSFETILTILSYGIIEPGFTYQFAHRPDLRIDVRPGTPQVLPKATGKKSSNTTHLCDERVAMPQLPKMKRPSKRLRDILIYAGPLLLLDLTMIKKFANTPINDIRVSGGYSPISPAFVEPVSGGIPSLNGTGGPSKSISTSFLLPTLHNFTISSPLQLERALPPVPPTSRRLILELFTSLFIYDALFFLCHLCFHRVPLLAKHHLPHHKHQEIHPQVTNQLSIIERLSLVLLANFSLNIIKSHVLTRTIFIPIFVTLLVQVHSGMDLPCGYDKFLPQGWAGGARDHARHHRTGEGGYAPFFTWCDQALNAGERWLCPPGSKHKSPGPKNVSLE